jgi:hypothetical protein
VGEEVYCHPLVVEEEYSFPEEEVVRIMEQLKYKVLYSSTFTLDLLLHWWRRRCFDF